MLGSVVLHYLFAAVSDTAIGLLGSVVLILVCCGQWYCYWFAVVSGTATGLLWSVILLLVCWGQWYWH